MTEHDSPKSAPEDNHSENIPEKKSLLSEILSVQNESEAKTLDGDTLHQRNQNTIPEANPILQEPPLLKKPREAISLMLFMKFIGAILLVSIIFFGSFLAYIVFHPDQASFFINIFGINPGDIANLLKKLINASFGIIIFILSIVWIISLFRAIWTPKDLKRKRLLTWLLAWLIGIILFSILGFWAFLFSRINLINFENLKWSILIYDNDLYTHSDSRIYADVSDGSNIIWPITLLFDIRSNATQVSKQNAVTIKGYRIDTDGGICNDGTSVVIGNNVADEKSIVCSFEKIKTYNIHGDYTVITPTGEEKKIPMSISPVEIRWLVTISRSKNIQGKPIISLDASNIKKLGNPRWVFAQSNKIIESSSITITVSKNPQYVCLRIITNGCDRMFVLEDADTQDIEWIITSVQDTIDPLLFHLGLSGSSIDTNQITNIEWLVVENKGAESVICSKWDGTCDFRFGSYGIQSVRVQIEMANKTKYSLKTELRVREPLGLSRNMRILDENGVLLNTESTYKTDLKAFVIENTLTPPAHLILDARSVSAKNEGYKLLTTVWKISNGKTLEEKRWEKINITLLEPLRYTITGIYTFGRTSGNEQEVTQDTVIIDIERKSLRPELRISMNSDYVPAIVTVDASESVSENGDIKKFIFNFWDGKTPTEWDAIQQYEYVTAGEKYIDVTIISENGEHATIRKTIVLKDEAKKINFIPSMTPGTINTPIDFEAAGTNGQIQDYIWKFGDDSLATHGYTTSHTYAQWWIYLIELTIIYSDGTRKIETKKYEVSVAN